MVKILAHYCNEKKRGGGNAKFSVPDDKVKRCPILDRKSLQRAFLLGAPNDMYMYTVLYYYSSMIPDSSDALESTEHSSPEVPDELLS